MALEEKLKSAEQELENYKDRLLEKLPSLRTTKDVLRMINLICLNMQQNH